MSENISIFATNHIKGMKYNILKITILLLIAVFNATIGFGCLPLWAYSIIEFASIILLVYVSVKMFRDNNMVIDQEIKKLTETISTISEQSKAQVESNASKLLDALSNNQEQVLDRLIKSEVVLNKNIENTTSQINEALNHLSNLIKKELSEQTEMIGTLRQNTTELFNCLSKEIQTLNESSRKQAIENTNELKRSLELSTKHISIVISDSLKTIQESTFNSSEQIKKQMEQICIAIQDSINTSATNLATKADTLNEVLKTTNDDIQFKIESASSGISQLISEGIGTITKSVSSGIEGARQASSESAEQIILANKENSASILQKVDDIRQHSIAIQDSMNTYATDLTIKTDALNEALKTTNDDIQFKVESASSGMSQLISEGIGTITKSVSSSIEGASRASSESAEQIMLTNKENSMSILQKVDELVLQGAILEKQNDTISSLIIDSVKESDKATEVFMSGLQDQYQTINKGLTSVQLKAENIEKFVQHISEMEFNKKIVDSIQSLIIELRTDIKNSISDINTEFLDTHIAQEATNTELEKLQVLLRTFLRSFEDKAAEQVAKGSNTQTKSSSSTQGVHPNATRSAEQNVKSHQPDPNRTESI
ncbi:MAG: hypothetical protein SOT90_03085, partial [Muribaculaceae bacterium]|nr:hypothetical protein [Muribaculaceae bacterium]